MPPFVLTVLKIVFLALLYFYVYRAIRSVVLDLRGGNARAARTVAWNPPRPAEGPARTAPVRGKAPRSVVVTNERGGKVEARPLSEGQLQIGRAEACQIRLPDTYVSQFHARIYPRDGAWFVEDLGSTNGTYLNQRRITSPAELRAGDRLRVGKTTLELRR
jgi:pSer/pThr/pTyr-binding forkhead associated (FHA) protein